MNFRVAFRLSLVASFFPSSLFYSVPFVRNKASNVDQYLGVTCFLESLINTYFSVVLLTATKKTIRANAHASNAGVLVVPLFQQLSKDVTVDGGDNKLIKGHLTALMRVSSLW